jgi:proteasome lid subunit RPN8/RPN11
MCYDDDDINLGLCWPSATDRRYQAPEVLTGTRGSQVNVILCWGSKFVVELTKLYCDRRGERGEFDRNRFIV